MAAEGFRFSGCPCVRDHILEVCEHDVLPGVDQRRGGGKGAMAPQKMLKSPFGLLHYD